MPKETAVQRAGAAAATVPGAVLTAVFGAASRLRPTAKPLHPRGVLHGAVVRRTGLAEPSGVPWLDEPGTDHALIRLSRATGVPDPLPDIHGLALRVPAGDRHADVLFASTGLGAITRFTLFAARRASPHAYSTLLPYRTPSGPLLLAAIPVDEDARNFTLAAASMRGPWRTFGQLEIEDVPGDAPTGDESVSFDPVTNQLPGLDYYPWATQLREGAYRASRWSRGGARATL
ncbi:MAG: hypothetical protein QOJ72_206 [Nocardioidaceae bacterium]|jgi:hypothetical protein|nr:hypothetical protein [Nocardioidaceae bacterium]